MHSYRPFRNTLRLGTSLMALTLLVVPAVAQEANSDEAEATRRLNVVTVTAEKREESVQDVPIAISAISGENLTASGVTDISTLDALVPGLQLGQSGTDARPAIRGARTENVSVQQDPVIAFYVDNIYRSRTSQALAAITDVSRVEVLRGPQGTLFGRNAFGGAVNIISNPAVDDTTFGANITIANFGRVRAEGFGNIALTDNLFFRVSGSIDNHDPLIENSFNPDAGLRDKDEDYIRAQLRWEPTDRFDATIRASRWTQGGAGNSDFGVSLLGTPVDPDPSTPFTAEEVIVADVAPINPRVGAGGAPTTGDPFVVDFDFETELDTEQNTIDLELNYDLGFANAKFLASYADFETGRDADTDLSSFNSGFSGQFDQVETWTQEIQVTSSHSGPLEWTVGGFFLQDDTEGLFIFDRLFDTDPVTNTPLNVTPTAFFSDFNALAEVDTRSFAFYGQATYSLTDSLRVTGGIRYTNDDREFSRVTTGFNTIPLTFFEADGVTPRPVFEDEETFDEVTWRAGVEYDLTPDNLI
ncbi:MAG: TonB-dependent receptor, partial [Pseudomonadota bacterium]